MIVELLVTCVLLDGQTFIPPKGWEVRTITAYDSSINCSNGDCYAINRADRSSPTTVTLARQAKLGESIAAPPGCQDLQATTKEQP